MFATATGEPINPNSDYHQWKELLRAAGLREGRLHDARHTAATVLLVLGVPERTVMGIMGWSSTGMTRRYQHVTDAIRQAVAEQIDGLLWGRQLCLAGRGRWQPCRCGMRLGLRPDRADAGCRSATVRHRPCWEGGG